MLPASIYWESTSPAEMIGVPMTARLPDTTIMVRQLGDVNIHTFTSSFADNNIADSTHIIESKNKLVLIDGQFLAPDAQKFRRYANSLGKPIERLYLTHRHPDHWFGLGTAFDDDIHIYALPETISFIKEHGKESLEDHLKKLGSHAPAKIVEPHHVARAGDETIDGVKYRFSKVVDTEIDYHLIIELPDIHVCIAQDLIYSGTHLYLYGVAGPGDQRSVTKYIENWITHLREMKDSHCELFLAGHGYQADKLEVSENIEYLLEAELAFARGLAKEDFKSFMLAKFPKRQCAGIFDIYLPRVFDGARDY
jgi:hypothetical protein